MQTSQTFEVRSRDVVAESFDDELIVLDLLSGKYFSLAGGAALVWRALLAGHSLDTLAAGLPADDERRAGAAGVVESLIANELIVARDKPAAGPADLVAAFATTTRPFAIDSFDDLSELLVADPIHDVDPKAGWPHQRPNA